MRDVNFTEADILERINEALDIGSNASMVFYKEGGAELSDSQQLAYAMGLILGALQLCKTALQPVPKP